MSYLHHECELERHIVEQLAASGEASMRPRLIAVDDQCRRGAGRRGSGPCFNEATADRRG